MTPKVGLLPLYLELYDMAMPEVHPQVEQFRELIVAQLEERGLAVVAGPVCRVEEEFIAAVRSFEDAQVDAIVTLHLAYSPSLESASALAQTRLPIIVLDTTPAYEFGPHQSPDEIMFNHGIHGVQDMCNLLIRKGKAFHIEAGHWEKSDVLDRVVKWAKAAHLARTMRAARVGQIGGTFKSMGDFAVPAEALRATIGIEIVPCEPSFISSLLADINEDEVEAEIIANLARFTADGLDPEAHRRTVIASLAVRRWLEQEKLSAFTINFMAVDRTSGLPTVPFLEASKAMARGTGYAGEGDVLTAALVGALASMYPGTTFTEMFCPDWSNNSVFISHMGEMNINLAVQKPRLIEKRYSFIATDSPVVAVGRFRPGEAVLVNLAPGPDDSYTLIIVPAVMRNVDGEDKMADTIHGWFRPDLPLVDFLAAYSRLGGTHHSALVYGDVAEEIAKFGEMMGWRVKILSSSTILGAGL